MSKFPFPYFHKPYFAQKLFQKNVQPETLNQKCKRKSIHVVTIWYKTCKIFIRIKACLFFFSQQVFYVHLTGYNLSNVNVIKILM